jgi:hypothetical protein
LNEVHGEVFKLLGDGGGLEAGGLPARRKETTNAETITRQQRTRTNAMPSFSRRVLESMRKFMSV